MRYVLMDRMAKPEEVLVKEDESGEIVRERTPDTDVIALVNVLAHIQVFGRAYSWCLAWGLLFAVPLSVLLSVYLYVFVLIFPPLRRLLSFFFSFDFLPRLLPGTCVQHRRMREALVFLTHLDPDATENVIMEKLSKQSKGKAPRHLIPPLEFHVSFLGHRNNSIDWE